MNPVLVEYLDSIDERLLTYLDVDQELALWAAEALKDHLRTLLESRQSPATSPEEWRDREDRWILLDAFIAAYGSRELQDLAEMSPLLTEVDEVDEATITPLDRNLLGEVEVALQLYVDSRSGVHGLKPTPRQPIYTARSRSRFRKQSGGGPEGAEMRQRHGECARRTTHQPLFRR
ncbi:MAG: hypothetical protein ACYCS2_01510 [Acidimicrobiales bacterium]